MAVKDYDGKRRQGGRERETSAIRKHVISLKKKKKKKSRMAKHNIG